MKYLKAFFSETIKPRAQILCIQHQLVIFYQSYISHAPGIKLGLPLWSLILHRFKQKNAFKTSFVKLQYQKHRYLVCSIASSESLQRYKSHAPGGSIYLSPRGHLVYLDFYCKISKKNFSESTTQRACGNVYYAPGVTQFIQTCKIAMATALDIFVMQHFAHHI